MSTTAVTAGQIMDRVASLLNDPAKTDYTYSVMIPYLNMAIEELSETMEESNNSPTNQSTLLITIPAGVRQVLSVDDTVFPPTFPRYPADLVEIQEIGERAAGSNDSFVRMTRLEFIPYYPPSSSLLYWSWEEQAIKFNHSGAIGEPAGATTDREIQLRYIAQAISYVANENSLIVMINSRSFLAFKTAALCAKYIGENESRADSLDQEADRAIERTTSISNKGRQQIVTRHRPFRAHYKSRGWF